MSALSPSALAAMRLDLENDPNWTRPRRQTNPDLIHRPSVLLRQATRRSADVSSLQNSSHSNNYSNPSSPLADQRPRTSGSITHSSAASSSATVTPTKRTSTSSHRSSLSASALSNPALAEIPSRKYNAARLSAGSTDGYAENYRQHHHNINNNNTLGGEPCAAAPRDPAATNAPATSAVNSLSPISTATPNSNYSLSSYSSYFPPTSPGPELIPPSSASSSTTKKPLPSSRLAAATSPSPATGTVNNDRLVRPTPKQAATPQTARPNNSQDSPSIDAVLKNKSILKKVGSSTDMASSPSRRRRESTPLSPRSAATASNIMSLAVDERYQSGSSAYGDSNADEQKEYSTDDTRRSDDVFLNIAKSSVNSRRNSLDRRRVS